MACTNLAQYDFVIRQGFDKVVQFRYLSGGEPVYLSGVTINFNSSLDILDQQAVITSAIDGEFEISFLGTLTDGLPQRRVKYEMISTVGAVNTLLFVGSINFDVGVD